MTRRVGGVVVLEREEPATCEECGVLAELRPYGRGGARICHPCGMKPENRRHVEAAFEALCSGADLAVEPGEVKS